MKRRCPIDPPGRQRADCLPTDKARLCDAAPSTNRSFSPAFRQLNFDQVNTGTCLWKDGGLNKQTCQLVVVHVVSARFGFRPWRFDANWALQESQLVSLLVDGLSASFSLRRRRRLKLRFWLRPSPRPDTLHQSKQLRERHQCKRLGFHSCRRSFHPPQIPIASSPSATISSVAPPSPSRKAPSKDKTTSSAS